MSQQRFTRDGRSDFIVNYFLSLIKFVEPLLNIDKNRQTL